jgi:anti-anti-sigma factor
VNIPGFEVDRSGDGRVVILRIVGRVEPKDLHLVEEAGNHLVSAGHTRFVVDCSRAETVSSMGLGLILYYKNLLVPRGGDICLAAPGKAVRSALSAASLDRVLHIYENVESAVAAMTPAADES